MAFVLVPKTVESKEDLDAQNANNTLYGQAVIDIMSNKCLPPPSNNRANNITCSIFLEKAKYCKYLEILLKKYSFNFELPPTSPSRIQLNRVRCKEVTSEYTSKPLICYWLVDEN